jgi:pentatricopeptide repeat protein
MVGEAMDVLTKRMPELGCMPNVVSYNTLLKGFCNETRAEEALELLHIMADGQGRSCHQMWCPTTLSSTVSLPRVKGTKLTTYFLQ